MFAIALTNASLPAKRRILKVCVKLFLEQGYKKTTVAEIIQKAEVSNSSFQNIFRAKDGVLTELVGFMFSNQFSAARQAAGTKLPPVFVYAIETALQITLTELNENLREIYIEAYSQREASEYIFRETARELYQIFGPYQPSLTAQDFYTLELGSAGLMRGYMAHPCDETLTLEQKLEAFLSLSLRGYCVPEDELQKVLQFIAGMDIRAISERSCRTCSRRWPCATISRCRKRCNDIKAPRSFGSGSFFQLSFCTGCFLPAASPEKKSQMRPKKGRLK